MGGLGSPLLLLCSPAECLISAGVDPVAELLQFNSTEDLAFNFA